MLSTAKMKELKDSVIEVLWDAREDGRSLGLEEIQKSLSGWSPREVVHAVTRLEKEKRIAYINIAKSYLPLDSLAKSIGIDNAKMAIDQREIEPYRQNTYDTAHEYQVSPVLAQKYFFDYLLHAGVEDYEE